MKLSIVIPCYNESKNIPLILERFSEVIKREDIEVVLVNNGSKDNSQEVMENFKRQYNFFRIVKVEENQGYGHGILEGLRSCNSEFLGWTHADMQTDPHDPIKALEMIEKHDNSQNIYIKGDRKGRPFADQFFTSGMSWFETFLMGTRLHDINAQPNIFHKDFFNSWESPPKDFSLDLYTLYTAKKKKLNIVRFPVLFTDRIHGESNWNTSFKNKWKFIKRTVDFSFELKKRLKR